MREDSQIESMRGLLIIASVALLITLMIMAWPYLLSNWDSLETDQGAYLELGLDVRNGLRLTDGARQFLFPLILGLFASSEWSYFTTAKLLSLGITLLSLTTLMFLNARLFNKEVALLSAALTVFNAAFLETPASRAMPEALLILFLILTSYFWYEGLVKDRAKFLVLSGITAGLAFLTKGTAQLLLTSFVIWALISGFYRKRWLVIASFITAYLVVALPFLLYNMQNWGNPFYNYSSAHSMWYDDWEDKYRLPDPNMATLGSYLASHDLNDIVARFVSGGRAVFQERASQLFPLYSVALLLVAAGVRWISLRDKKQYSRQVTDGNNRDVKLKAILIPVVVLAVWFIFFSWYSPISNAPRHFVVILPLVNTTVSVLFVYAVAAVNSEWAKKFLPGALAIAVIAACLYGSMSSVVQLKESYETFNVYASDVQNNREIDELLHGLESSNGQVTVINGPSELIPSWRARKTTLTIEQIPNEVSSMQRLSAFITDTNASYLIIDPQMVSHRPFLREYFSLKSANDVEMTREVPNMTLMADYRLNRRRIMIFERAEF